MYLCLENQHIVDKVSKLWFFVLLFLCFNFPLEIDDNIKCNHKINRLHETPWKIFHDEKKLRF